MENDKINDEFYASEDEEIKDENPIEESNLQSEEPKESSIEETQEPKEEHEDPNILSNNTFEVEKEESQVEGSTEVPADVELSRTAELRMMFGESPTPSKPKNNEQNNNEQKNNKHKNKHKNKNKFNENKAVEQNNTVQQNNNEQHNENYNKQENEVHQNNDEQQNNNVQQSIEKQNNELLHIEQEHIEPKHIDPIPEPERIPFSGNELKIKEEPEIPNNIKETPKYESFSHRMLRYGLFTILSLVFLTIAIVGFNKFKKDTSTYTEDAKVNYQVCLKENDYYKDQCIGEEKEYISSATETIRLDYSYNAVYQKIAKKDYKYYIKSTLLIKTDDDNEKELLKKEKNLTKKQKIELNGNVMTIAETIDIPFQEYNSYAQKYKNDYSLVSNCYLEVSLILKDGKEETVLSSVTMPLTKITYNITKNEKVNEISEYKVPTNLALRILFTVLIILGLGLILYSVYDLGKFLFKMRRKESAYDKKLKQILNTYDRVIITLEDKNTVNPDQDVYTVKSFLELLDVRDTIDKPILYHKVNNIKSEFYVQDINKTYKFTMKESDFEEKQ